MSQPRFYSLLLGPESDTGTFAGVLAVLVVIAVVLLLT